MKVKLMNGTRPEGGIVDPLTNPSPFVPLRLFISYGHDGNVSLVRRIKADLESRGHDVWFDECDIKSGQDWRRRITDGILQSHRVLVILSKHSTRDPGVCLDEIAIAIGIKGGNIQTILVESEREVEPPPSVSHIQWLDMHDWKERRAAGNEAWEKWYEEKLREIISVVESDESQRFAGEIEDLKAKFKPTSSDFAADVRIRALLKKELVGRVSLFDQVEQWRNAADRASDIFWIVGSPGVGKSAFAAHLAHYYGRGTVIAVHFCDWQKPDHRDACRIIRTLAFQIATRLPDYRKLLLTLPEIDELEAKRPDELFDYLLVGPLHQSIDGARERYLVVIDALDEAGGEGSNELVEILARKAQRLPGWIGLVVTSRSEIEIKTSLHWLNPFVLDTQTDENRRDISNYLRRELAPQLKNRSDANVLIEQLLQMSEGVFLYVERVCIEIAKHRLSLDHLEDFPRGLGEVYQQYFNRLFPLKVEKEEGLAKSKVLCPEKVEWFNSKIRPVLEVIAAAREPLELAFIASMFNWNEYEQLESCRSLSPIFHIEGGRITSFHSSVIEWMTDPEKAGFYSVSVRSGHLALADVLWVFRKQVGLEDVFVSGYRVRHLPLHLAKAERWEDLDSLIQLRGDVLFTQWVELGKGDDGLVCMGALLDHLWSSKKQKVRIAQLATQIGRIHAQRANYDTSRRILKERAIAVTSWIAGRKWRSVAFHELGSLELYESNYRSARYFYFKSLTLCVLGVPIYFGEIAGNALALATVALEQHEYVRGIVYSRMGWLAAILGLDRIHQTGALRLLAAAYKGLGNFKRSRRIINRAISLTRRFWAPIEETRLLITRGWLNFELATEHRQIPIEAQSDFAEAREVAKRIANYFLIIDANIGTGWCALVRKENETASNLFDEAEAALSAQVHRPLVAGAKAGRAAALHQRGEIEEAVKAYQEVIRFCDDYSIPLWDAIARVGLGSVLWHQGKMDSAAKSFDEALGSARRVSKSRERLIKQSISLCREDPTMPPR